MKAEISATGLYRIMKNKPSNPNGCYDRPAFKRDYVAFDGYTDASRTQAQTIRVPNVMSPDCQYSKTTPDPRCAGCIHEFKK